MLMTLLLAYGESAHLGIGSVQIAHLISLKSFRDR